MTIKVKFVQTALIDTKIAIEDYIVKFPIKIVLYPEVSR